MKLSKIIIMSVSTLFLTVFMSACGGSGESEGAKEVPLSVSANGLWSGTQVIDGLSYDVQFITYDNKFYGYSQQAYSMFSGTSSLEGNTLTSNPYYTYNGDGSYLTKGNLTANVVEDSSINASFTNGLNQSGSFNVAFDPSYYKPSSLTYIQDHYTSPSSDFTISAQGIIAGISNGCDIKGQVSIPNPFVNIYSINYTLDNCLAKGTYTGLGTITLDINNNAYFQAGMSNEENMDLLIVEINEPNTF